MCAKVSRVGFLLEVSSQKFVMDLSFIPMYSTCLAYCILPEFITVTDYKPPYYITVSTLSLHLSWIKICFTYIGFERPESDLEERWIEFYAVACDREIGDCTLPVPKQQPTNNGGMVFSVWSTKQQLNSNRGKVFSVQSVLRCYKRDNQ
jgi:hypothetical protein